MDDVFVAEQATESDDACGDEPSGAWIRPDQTLYPAGPLAACKLSALVDGIEQYPIHRGSLEVAERTATMGA
ncbi:hypothetical protein [Salinarchaeum laminariae]|uniref:hypothetical protein n=1 Tax=Salinarchaeum laminariae TaxID=869888 RepID=UPI0020BE015B|nr:hypothetical protein [Salinarchaeum laminariae]